MNNKLLIGRAVTYCKRGNSIWYVGKNVSFLFKLDLDKFEIVKMISIPILDNPSGFDYIDIINDEDSIYIISYDAKTILCYSKEDEDIEIWHVPVEFKKAGDRRVFKTIKYKEKIYLIGCLDYKDIIVFDIIKKEAQEIKNTENCNCFSYCCMLEKDMLIIPYFENSKIMKIDLHNGHQNVIQIENVADGYMDCVAISDGYVFVSINGRVVKFDKFYNIIWERQIGERIYCVKAIQDNSIAVWGLLRESVWIVSEFGRITEIKLKNQDLSVLDNNGYSKFEMVVPIKDKVLFQQRMTGEFYVLENDSFTKQNILASKEKIDEMYRFLRMRKKIYSEGELLGCEEFLQMFL